MGAPLNFLIEPLEHIGALHVFVMGQRQPEVGQRLLDIVLDPGAELGVLDQPLGDVAPYRTTQISTGAHEWDTEKATEISPPISRLISKSD